MTFHTSYSFFVPCVTPLSCTCSIHPLPHYEATMDYNLLLNIFTNHYADHQITILMLPLSNQLIPPGQAVICFIGSFSLKLACLKNVPLLFICMSLAQFSCRLFLSIDCPPSYSNVYNAGFLLLSDFWKPPYNAWLFCNPK